ncbi:hypothetical protein [Phenylobacterium kunshanense]|uniref:Uncharacterized protein n=1 Tax=Phenylobacterium kunshanense TaxID=1445034 RepID=A0A328BD58_9CAUL|nr:hypothetical protein [Phenylobacterium kunshanense]RAK64857.1 hypothetical protein DJ019_12645 [Phenylobacterium kunshanense]
MGVRPWAEFRSDLPTDTIETPDEIVQVGGRTVAEAIGEILARLGCKADSPVLEGENGWQFMAIKGRCRMMCQVAHIERFLLLLEDTSFFNRVLKRHSPVYLDILSRFAEELARDPRFHDIEWYFANEVLSGKAGAPMPVSVED